MRFDSPDKSDSYNRSTSKHKTRLNGPISWILSNSTDTGSSASSDIDPSQSRACDPSRRLHYDCSGKTQPFSLWSCGDSHDGNQVIQGRGVSTERNQAARKTSREGSAPQCRNNKITTSCTGSSTSSRIHISKDCSNKERNQSAYQLPPGVTSLGRSRQPDSNVAARSITKNELVAFPSAEACWVPKLNNIVNRWQDAYQLTWKPRKFIVKFRQQMEGLQLGANCEFRRIASSNPGTQPESATSHHSIGGFDMKSATWKFVLKPCRGDLRWKVLFEPHRHDVRLLTQKIPVGGFFNFQMGLGHNFRHNTTGLKWRLSSVWSSSRQSTLSVENVKLSKKTTFPVSPGVDLRAGWTAEYILPDIHGSAGTEDPVIGLNSGQLSVSIERIETIFTHMW